MNDCKFITLDNGLTVLIYSDKTKITNHVELITFLGGFNNKFTDYTGKEKIVYPGCAHLLEHYVCENSNYGDLIDNLTKLKVLDANASTNFNETSFYFDTVYNFKECLELFLKSIYNVNFNAKGLDKTKFAVYNEIRDSKDNFRRKVINTKLKNLFSTACETLGNKSSINKIGYKYLSNVYDNFYVPKNQFLVVAGNFDDVEVIELINKVYSNLKFKCNERIYKDIAESKVCKKEDTIKGGSLNEVIISFKIDVSNLSSFEKYKLDWYLNYFSDNCLSRFASINEKLKNSGIMTGNITSCVYNACGYTVLEVIAYTDKKDDFIREVFDVINGNNMEKEDFELSKKSSLLNISVRKDNISNYVIPVIANYMEFAYPFDDTLEFVNSLNYDDYVTTIKELDFSNYSVLVIFCK